jgi:hypothetical protein
MSGLAWLALAWVVLVPVAAVTLGKAIRTADDQDWVRRGRPDRRSQPRDPPASDTVGGVTTRSKTSPQSSGCSSRTDAVSGSRGASSGSSSRLVSPSRSRNSGVVT